MLQHSICQARNIQAVVDSRLEHCEILSAHDSRETVDLCESSKTVHVAIFTQEKSNHVSAFWIHSR